MRRTGKTFRALLGALKQASAGEQVIYECSTYDMARWSFTKAIKIVADFMDPCVPEKLVIKIGDGTVRFVKRLNPNELESINFSQKYKLIQDY